MKFMRSLKYLVAFCLILGSYQNCSQQEFGSDFYESALEVSSIKIEDGRAATNKKVVKVEILTPDASLYAKMRLDLNENLSAEEGVWRDFSTVTEFDFGDGYLPFGEKDGLKTIYVDLMTPNSKILRLKGEIGLDTLSPKAEFPPNSIASKGIQGKSFKKGDLVDISINLYDRKAPTGYSAGIDAIAGLKAVTVSLGDCDQAVKDSIFDWSPPKSDFSISWPTNNPLETFFICIFVKDVAGNVGTLLSQPMVSLWRVLAGDNNQGNGGSVTDPHVRFKSPSTFATDSKGNIFVSDIHFNNIRKIDKQGNISLVVGNGLYQTPTEGPALASGFTGTNKMSVDSKDRIYFHSQNSTTGTGAIYRLEPEEGAGERYRVRCLVTASDFNFSILTVHRELGGQDILYVHHSYHYYPDKPASYTNNYLFRIPVADLENRTQPLTLQDLKTNHKLAGNGRVSSTSFTIPFTVTLSKNDSEFDQQYALDYPSCLTTDSQGTLYLCTSSPGSGTDYSHHSTRKLEFNEDGTVKQTLLQVGVGYIGNSIIITYDNRPQLLMASNWGLALLDPVTATEGKNAKITNYGQPVTNVRLVSGLSEVPSGTLGGKAQFIVGDTEKSRLVFLDNNFSFQGSYGRAVYSSEDSRATDAVLACPQGITQTRLGNTYFIDVLNNIVRKVDETGTITTTVGNPNKYASGYYADADLKEMTLNTSGGYLGYSLFHNLESESNSESGQEVLYVGENPEYYGRIHRVDLTAKKVSTIVGDAAKISFDDYQKKFDTTSNWPLWGFHIQNGELLMGRYFGWNLPRQNGLLTKSILPVGATRATAEEILIGNKSIGAGTNLNHLVAPDTVSLQSTTRIRRDSKGTIYFTTTNSASGSNGMLGVYDPSKPATSPEGKLNAIKVNGGLQGHTLGTFELIEEGDQRHFIGFMGADSLYPQVQLYHGVWDLTSLGTATAQDVTFSRLCFPGSFWNRGIRAMALTKNGNLLISDSNSARIIEYFIRDQNGNLKFEYCP